MSDVVRVQATHMKSDEKGGLRAFPILQLRHGHQGFM